MRLPFSFVAQRRSNGTSHNGEAPPGRLYLIQAIVEVLFSFSGGRRVER